MKFKIEILYYQYHNNIINMITFYKSSNCFSNWFRCHFDVQRVYYNSSEQWMMAEKARLFHDREIEKKIMSSKSPREQKKLGRKIRGFRENVWQAHRLDIMVRGLMSKFSQNLDLKRTLLATGDREIVEASPHDRIWGVGLAENDPRINDKSKWKGLNLLGISLMCVRQTLRDQDIGS